MKKNSLNLYKKQPVKETVSIIGVPFEEGSGATGLATNPKYLRKCGIVKQLIQSGIEVVDNGDVFVKQSKSKDKKILKQLAIEMAGVVSKKVETEISLGRRVLALGGDHSISLGTISGASIAKDKDIGVIWIDAHPDISTWEESLTKNVHGMLVSSLLGVGDRGLVNILEDGAKIKKQNVLYIGLKDMDDYEIDYLKKERINVVTMFDVQNQGMNEVLNIVDKFLKKHKNIWVSMDMDSIQKRYVPSSPMATDEGFTPREILNLARFIGRTANVIGVDIVEMSSAGDTDKRTANLAIDLSAKLFGSDSGWYEGYMNEHKK